MRTSNDTYKMSDGSLKNIDQITSIPLNATLWQGYDYINQYWVYEGKRDVRTLEQLQQAINKER